MKVVIDCLGADAKSGGMRLHASQIVASWSEAFPSDRLIVVGPPWARKEFAHLLNVRIVVWPNEHAASRAFGQLVVSALVFVLTQAQFLVSLSPVVSLLVPSRSKVCFQHDWRHLRNPHEFELLRRFYRKLWALSASRSLFNACISEKAMAETAEFAPGSRTVLVENGWDHARNWDVAEVSGDPYFVTFGHHTNKRPHLVVEAISHMPHETRRGLTVLGTKDNGRFLNRLATQLGVEGFVDARGFVSDAEYRSVVSNSFGVVLASSDEGFGLPLAEAAYLGKVAITTSDSGISSIFPAALVAHPSPESLAQRLVESLSVKATDRKRDLPTWRDAVECLRTEMLCRGGRLLADP